MLIISEMYIKITNSAVNCATLFHAGLRSMLRSEMYIKITNSAVVCLRLLKFKPHSVKNKQLVT